MVLQLHSLAGRTIELPYAPDAPLWQYLRDVVAPTAGFALVDDGRSVRERVVCAGVPLDFANKHRRLGDLVEDGGRLHYTLALGPG